MRRGNFVCARWFSVSREKWKWWGRQCNEMNGRKPPDSRPEKVNNVLARLLHFHLQNVCCCSIFFNSTKSTASFSCKFKRIFYISYFKRSPVMWPPLAFLLIHADSNRHGKLCYYWMFALNFSYILWYKISRI